MENKREVKKCQLTTVTRGGTVIMFVYTRQQCRQGHRCMVMISEAM